MVCAERWGERGMCADERVGGERLGASDSL